MQNAQRVRGVALTAARDLHVGDCDLHARVERDLLAHQARHRKAVVRPCRVGGEHLVRRDTRRNEQELIQRALLRRLDGGVLVPQMRRVEAAAVNSDLQ